MFEKGDRVTYGEHGWEGVVVGIIPANVSPSKAFGYLTGIDRKNRDFHLSHKADHDRVLVRGGRYHYHRALKLDEVTKL